MDKEAKEAINVYINGIKKGDKESIIKLYPLISPPIRYIALKYLRNDFDADDLVQDFWADINRISKGFIISNNGFSYLCKVMTRKAINRYNKIHREQNYNVEFIDYSSLHNVAGVVDYEAFKERIAVEKAMDELTNTEKLIIQLIYFEDKNLRDIAKELGISKSSVSLMKINAVDKMKNYFDKNFLDKIGR